MGDAGKRQLFVRMRNPTSMTVAVSHLQEYARIQMEEKRNRHWTRPYDRPKEDRQEYNGNKKGMSMTVNLYLGFY